jgi:hypothetical protein
VGVTPCDGRRCVGVTPYDGRRCVGVTPCDGRRCGPDGHGPQTPLEIARWLVIAGAFAVSVQFITRNAKDAYC